MRDATPARATARAAAAPAAAAPAVLPTRPAATLVGAKELQELRRDTAGLLLLLLLQESRVGPSSEELRLAELGHADRPLCGREGRGEE